LIVLNKLSVKKSSKALVLNNFFPKSQEGNRLPAGLGGLGNPNPLLPLTLSSTHRFKLLTTVRILMFKNSVRMRQNTKIIFLKFETYSSSHQSTSYIDVSLVLAYIVEICTTSAQTKSVFSE
jgi:hypothetical protein